LGLGETPASPPRLAARITKPELRAQAKAIFNALGCLANSQFADMPPERAAIATFNLAGLPVPPLRLAIEQIARQTNASRIC